MHKMKTVGIDNLVVAFFVFLKTFNQHTESYTIVVFY